MFQNLRTANLEPLCFALTSNFKSRCESIPCPCRTHRHFQAGAGRCCSQVRIDQSCCAKGAKGSPGGLRSSCKGSKTQRFVCKEAGYPGGEPQGLNAAQATARHQPLATTPKWPQAIAATVKVCRMPTHAGVPLMLRSPVKGGRRTSLGGGNRGECLCRV